MRTSKSCAYRQNINTIFLPKQTYIVDPLPKKKNTLATLWLTQSQREVVKGKGQLTQLSLVSYSVAFEREACVFSFL